MQHAIIENVGGKTVIASWEPSPIDLDRLMVIFQSKESFLLRYSNRSVSLKSPTAGVAFKRSQHRWAIGGSRTVIGFSFAA